MTNHNPQNFANVKTTRASKSGFNRPYFLIDASVKPIGRVASEAARILMGKNRADYSPDVDMGGMVIIINAKDQTFTGKKAERKVYFRYGRRLGSLKSRGYEEAFKLDFKFPLYNAIKKMMPRNRHQDLRVNNRLFATPGGPLQHSIARNERDAAGHGVPRQPVLNESIRISAGVRKQHFQTGNNKLGRSIGRRITSVKNNGRFLDFCV